MTLKSTALVFAIVMLTMTGHAEEQYSKAKLARAAAVIALYNEKCSPPHAIGGRAFATVADLVTKGDIMIESLKIDDEIEKIGQSQWCKIARTLVENADRNFKE